MQYLLLQVSPPIKGPKSVAQCLSRYNISHFACFFREDRSPLTHSPDEKGKTQCGNLMRAVEILQKPTIRCWIYGRSTSPVINDSTTWNSQFTWGVRCETYTQSEPIETVTTANHFLTSPRLYGCWGSFSFNSIVASIWKFEGSLVAECPTSTAAWGTSQLPVRIEGMLEVNDPKLKMDQV